MASDPRAEILAAIPHRPPFLFVDAIVERTAASIVTQWYVDEHLACFEGHYPGQPILPGVIISEFTFQSAAILLAGCGDARVSPARIPVLTKIEDARFKKIVLPGETLIARVELVERLSNARYMKASVTSAGATVARLSFTVSVVDARAPERVP